MDLPQHVVALGYPALLLLVVCCIAVGVVAAVVNTWNLRARLFSLETQVDVLSGQLSREIKARAGQERWKKPDRDAELMSHLLQQPPVRKKNWWESLPNTPVK